MTAAPTSGFSAFALEPFPELSRATISPAPKAPGCFGLSLGPEDSAVLTHCAPASPS